MVIDEALATGAQKYAEELDKQNKFEHSPREERNGAGENLAMHSDPATASNTTFCTDTWYEEVKDYDFANQGFGMGTGHFT